MENNGVVIYQTLPDEPSDILMIFTLDNDKFNAWGKPLTGYAKIAEETNKINIDTSGPEAFDNYFSGGTFSKLASRMETLTPRERKKVNTLIKKWNTQRNESRSTT